jgi:hypothetical protein
VRLQLDDFPEDVIEQYNLREKARNGAVYVECRCCVYGLPPADDGIVGVLRTHKLAAVADVELLRLVKSESRFVVLVGMIVFEHAFPSSSGWNAQNQGPDLEEGLSVLLQVIR